jgi:hypothetical protein
MPYHNSPGISGADIVVVECNLAGAGPTHRGRFDVDVTDAGCGRPTAVCGGCASRRTTSSPSRSRVFLKLKRPNAIRGEEASFGDYCVKDSQKEEDRMLVSH